MVQQSPQPNLVVIGAQKSGTTSLYHYLNAHPQIFMSSPIKEPGYFMKIEFILKLFRKIRRPVESRRQMLEQHMLKGYRGEPYFGEASTYYTISDHCVRHDVPARMQQTNPGMKLIYIVRNPFARIISNYLHSLRAGYFKGDFRTFIGTRHYQHALLTSRYWFQLRAYLEHFPKQQIKIVLFEDLIADCQRMMDEIYTFLELDPAGEMGFEAHNQSDNRQVFDNSELLFPMVAYWEAAPLVQSEINRLEEFMQRELSNWDLSEERWCANLLLTQDSRSASASRTNINTLPKNRT